MANEFEVLHEVVLPCGVLSNDGKTVDRRAVIREMSAGLKATLGKKEFRKDGWRQVDTVLASCVAALGDVPNPPFPLVNSRLVFADREYLAYRIKKHSIDPLVHARMFCTQCEAIKDTSVNLDDLNQYGLPDPQDIDAATMPMRVIPAVDPRVPARWGYFVANEDRSIEAVLRYETGAERAPFVDSIVDNEALGLSQLLAQSLVSLRVGGRDIKCPMAYEDFERLPARVSVFLDDAWTRNQPGLDLRVKIKCQECGSLCPWTMSSPDFFTQRSETTRNQRSGQLKKLSGR